MKARKQTIWQPSVTAMLASHTCALIVILVAAGSALLKVEPALPLVQAGLVASGLLINQRPRLGTTGGAAANGGIPRCARVRGC